MPDIYDTDELPVDPVALRAKLRASIARRKSENARLEALQQALEKVIEDGWAASRRHDDAVTELNKLRSEASARLAYTYLNGSDEVDPIPAAEAELATAAGEDHRLDEIRAALEAEIARVRLNLRNDVTLAEAVTAVVISSPECAALRTQHDETLKRLRTIKVTLRALAAVLYGPQSMELNTVANSMERLERGFGPIDEDFVAQWVDALEALSCNADVQLPGAVQPPPQRPVRLIQQPMRSTQPNGNGAPAA